MPAQVPVDLHQAETAHHAQVESRGLGAADGGLVEE